MQDYLCAVGAGQENGGLPRVITGCRGILFIGGVLFIGHHHQPQVAEGEEEGAAGPQNHMGLPGAQNLGYQFAFGGRKAAVVQQNGRNGFPYMGFQLAGRADFRHQIQYAFPFPEAINRQGQEQFRSGGGSSFQQYGLTAGKAFLNLFQGCFPGRRKGRCIQRS